MIAKEIDEEQRLELACFALFLPCTQAKRPQPGEAQCKILSFLMYLLDAKKKFPKNGGGMKPKRRIR